MSGPVGPELVLNGRPAVNFGSNNYLGLTLHPEVMAAARESLETSGTGAGASRLVTGNHAVYAPLESALAGWKRAESCVVFPSGFAAATGTIPALVGEGDVIAADRLNHASLIDGARLSKARLLVYPHADAAGLEALLGRVRGRYRRALVITDGLFSMDGDLAPLPALMGIAERHDAWVLVDDAHATGTHGSTGSGTPEHFGLPPSERLIQMGTLSKALASLGGFVCGPAPLGEWLVNRSRPLVYSTGLPPACVAAALAAVNVARRDPALRERLRVISRRVRAAIASLGLVTFPGESAIVPVLLGDERRAMRWAASLLERGCFVPGIRPPTVPAGTARLRISLMATHTDDQVDRLLRALKELSTGDPG